MIASASVNSKKGINIEDYSIYSQLQLCIKGDCLSKGNYWIPDFALVSKKTNALDQEYLEIIIIDSKLSRGTGWSPNQNAADAMTSWKIKTVNENNLIQGVDMKLVEDLPLIREGKFIKMFEENTVIKTDFK